MQRRLAMADVARIDVTEGLLLIDAADLLGEKSRMTAIVINAGQSEQHHRDIPVLRTDQRFSVDLGLRVRPSRRKRRVFIDRLSRLGRRMHEHARRKDELSDLKLL